MASTGTFQKTLSLPPGVAANEETLRFMAGLARSRGQMPCVRNIARGIIFDAGIQNHDFLNEAKALANFVQKHVHYQRDPEGQELIIDPLTLLDQIYQGKASGDCDDHALLINCLIIANGGKPFFRAVRFHDLSGPYDHVYCVTYDRNFGGNPLRIAMDAIVKDRPIGHELPHKSGQEYPS